MSQFEQRKQEIQDARKKYCDDCKHFSFHNPANELGHHCSAPGIADIARLVYRSDAESAVGASLDAALVRAFSCGIEGKWWEAKA